MKYLSEKEYEKRLKKIQKENESIERLEKLDSLKRHKTKKKISTSKFMAVYLMLVFNTVLIYSLIVMYQFKDLSYLGVLITDIAGQVLTYFIYARKSAIENSKDGIVFETAMRELDMRNEGDNT